MEAMVNPNPAWPTGHYKNAITGDYDLMAIWPLKANFDPRGEDRRLAGMGPAGTGRGGCPVTISLFKTKIAKWVTSPIACFLRAVCNSAVGANRGGFPLRNMCHHSDEGGRPFVGDVDLPLIAFVPAKRNYAFAISTISDSGYSPRMLAV